MKHFISYPLNSNSTNSIIISTLLWGISVNNNEVLSQVLIDNYSKSNLKSDFRFEEWKAKHIPEIISDSTKIDTSLVTSILEKCTVMSKGTKLICECGFVEILCSDKKLYDRRKPYNLVTSDKCLKCGSMFKLKETLNLVIPAREFIKCNDFEIVPGNIRSEILSMLSQVGSQEILVSRVRETGANITVFDKFWNIDPDILNIIALYSSTLNKEFNDVTFVSSRRSIRKMALYYRIFGIIPNHILIPKINIPNELKNDIHNLNGGSILLPILGSLSWKRNSVFFDFNLYKRIKNMDYNKVLKIINQLPKIKMPSDFLKLNRNTIKI